LLWVLLKPKVINAFSAIRRGNILEKPHSMTRDQRPETRWADLRASQKPHLLSIATPHNSSLMECNAASEL
jgi:hypothetical protein